MNHALSLSKGSIPNMNNIVNLSCLTPEPKSHSFVDTIHGLTDRLHQLSHLGHDSCDNKSKSGNFFTLQNYTCTKILFKMLLYSL